MQNEVFPAILDKLYSAAIDPEHWSGFLDSMIRAARATSGAIHVQRLNEPRARIDLFPGVEEEYRTQWEDYYFKRNCWLNASVDQMSEGCVMVSEQVLANSQLVRTEYYADYLRRIDIFHAINLCIWKSPSGIANLSLFRRKGTGFGDKEQVLLRQIYPHLRRALQVHSKAANCVKKERVLEDAVDRIRAGLIIVDGRARIQHTNSRAAVLLSRGEGLTSRKGQLHAADDPRNDSRLQSLITAAAQRAGNPGGVLVVQRSADLRPLNVTVIPLRYDSFTFLDQTEPLVLLMIYDPDGQAESTLDHLRDWWELTEAEASLSRLIVGGHSLQSAATCRGVSLHTVRAQMKSVFLKTQTHSQTELVRLILGAGNLARSAEH